MAFPEHEGLRCLELGTPGEMRQRLVALVLAGEKRATAGLLSEYADEGEPLETVGEEQWLLGDDGALPDRLRPKMKPGAGIVVHRAGDGQVVAVDRFET